MEGCPYESAQGLQAGDRFYSIDGHRIYQYYDVADFLARGDGRYDIVLIRDGEKIRLKDYTLVPLEYEGQENRMYGFYLGYDEASPGVKLRYTWNTAMEFGRWVWMGPAALRFRPGRPFGYVRPGGHRGLDGRRPGSRPRARRTRSTTFFIWVLLSR